MTELLIDKEFEALIPPLTKEEYAQLEENIVAEGAIFTPIFTWNGYIVDGHHRYSILRRHPEVAYRVSEKAFADRYEAMMWICSNQLGRRNLTEAQKTALIGRRYKAEKKAHGCQERFHQLSDTASPHFDDKQNRRTSQRIADELGISKSTVERAAKFVEGLEIAEGYVPGITKKVMEGKVKLAKQEVIAIANAAPEERSELLQALFLTPKEKAARRAAMREISAKTRALSPTLLEEDAQTEDTAGALSSIKLDLEQAIGTLNTNFQRYHEMFTDVRYKAEVDTVIERIEEYARSLRAQQKYDCSVTA